MKKLQYLSIETRQMKVKISNRKVYVPDKARVQKKRQNSLIPLVLTFNAELFVSNATSIQL